MPDLPLPGQAFEGNTVIASVWGNDDPNLVSVMDGKLVPVWALLMLLRPEPPYYMVAEIKVTDNGWQTYQTRRHRNIVPTTEDYQAKGGDY